MMRIILLSFICLFLIVIDSGKSFNRRILGNGIFMEDSTNQEIITDSDYSLEDALKGISIPSDIRQNLAIVVVQYFSFDKKLHRGQIVINKILVKDIVEVFRKIKAKEFPVAKVIPIVKYNWNDEASMEDNNTSAFNYRFIAGTKKLSNHSFGTAIDINPLLNPYIRKDLHQPEGSVYNPIVKGTITGKSFLVKEFKKLGWDWGGNWSDRKDYQHFEKKQK
jgi:peptidoglycan LD-endopeptidase CwlK